MSPALADKFLTNGWPRKSGINYFVLSILHLKKRIIKVINLESLHEN